MGLKYFILMIFSGGLLFFSTFCSNRNSSMNEHELFICGQVSPQWFKDEVQKVADNSPLFKPIKVFLVNDDNGTEYIAIEDHSKNATCKLKVFLCSGKELEPCEEKYSAIVQKYEKKEVKIIWPE
ncbi:MAG: hypothetical protein FWH18_00445 [Marinilabiliaceae bacterium]|nr:hypothetical protein [Marinilabiliaceae bacterium]